MLAVDAQMKPSGSHEWQLVSHVEGLWSWSILDSSYGPIGLRQ